MLAALGQAADYSVIALDAESLSAHLPSLTLTHRASVVVATHGEADAEVLEQVVNSNAGYVSLVASRRRADAIEDTLKGRGVPEERLARLKAPAGLDIGAVTPREIAISILAEVIQHHRRPAAGATAGPRPRVPAVMAEAPEHARDPVCGMTVDIATARHRSDLLGRSIYFCCGGCKESFDRDPHRYV
jgi:xanthine dehydrogenase accessory factor